MSGQQVIPGGSQRIQIAADICQAAIARLFRRHVIQSADGRARPRDAELFVARFAGQAEVGQLDHHPLALRGDEKIRGFDVAMD